MYNTSASDLDRTASDLNSLATTYTNSAQQLDQQVTSLDGTTSQLVNSGSEKWQGRASEAFLGAWSERKTRMQQAAQLLDESAQYLKQLAQTINDQVPAIRSSQTAMTNTTYAHLPSADQQSIINAESQAQNAIAMALGTINSQLEWLAEGVKDCPQEKQQNNLGGLGGNVPNNVSKDISKAKGSEPEPSAPSGEGGSSKPSSLEDITKDPYALNTMTPEEVKALAEAEGWRVEKLGKGSHKGQGLVVREEKDGKLTGTMIQWHPGGGHHGPDPYWKVSSGTGGGTTRVGPQFP